jgi:hypothetical protein
MLVVTGSTGVNRVAGAKFNFALTRRNCPLTGANKEGINKQDIKVKIGKLYPN